MKILWVGPVYSSPSILGKLKVKAIRSLGHEVVIFDNRRVRLPILKWLPTPICHRLRRKIERLAKLDTALMNKQLLHTVKVVKPDLVVADKALNVNRFTVEEIGKMGVITANWFPDELQRIDWIRQVAPSYPCFFSFDPYLISVLRNDGLTNVYYLPFGCDPNLHRTVDLTPTEMNRYGSEVCFIGAYYPEREKVLSGLTGFHLKIWGYKDWAKTSLKPFYRGLIGNDEEMVKAYNACRIALNIHFHSAAYGVNYRTFEIAGCGVLQLIDERPDVVNLFEVGREIVTYSSPEDLEEKVTYYLDHPDERQAIARAGQTRAYSDHTIQQRMGQLIQVVTGGEEARDSLYGSVR